MLERQPLLAILVAPRRTMRRILDHLPDRSVIPLVIAAFLSGVMKEVDPRGLQDASTSLGPLPLTLIVICASLAGVALAIGIFWGGAWITTMAGRWLEGTGTFAGVRSALAWGAAPLIWALLYRIPARLLFNDAYRVLHSSNRNSLINIRQADVAVNVPSFGDVGILPVVVLALLDLAAIVGFLVVTSRTLAEAQGFESSWRGFGNLLLAFVLPIVGIAVIALAILWK